MIVELYTAILAKEKGFNEWCDDYYRNEEKCYEAGGVKSSDTFDDIYPAPTQVELQTWLREKKGYHVYCYLNMGKDGYNVTIESINNIKTLPMHIGGGHEDYNISFEYGLFNALNLVK